MVYLLKHPFKVVLKLQIITIASYNFTTDDDLKI